MRDELDLVPQSVQELVLVITLVLELMGFYPVTAGVVDGALAFFTGAITLYVLEFPHIIKTTGERAGCFYAFIFMAVYFVTH